MNRKEFLEKIPDSNMEWAAQRMAYHFTDDQLRQLQTYFNLLDTTLFKGWSKDITFAELKNAIDLISELKK